MPLVLLLLVQGLLLLNFRFHPPCRQLVVLAEKQSLSALTILERVRSYEDASTTRGKERPKERKHNQLSPCFSFNHDCVYILDSGAQKPQLNFLPKLNRIFFYFFDLYLHVFRDYIIS